MARYPPVAVLLALFVFCTSPWLFASASPFLPLPTQFSHHVGSSEAAIPFSRRTDADEPQFPDDIPSCPICAENFGSISSCAEAAPVLQNFTMIIFNPSAFIDVIKCACVDTFQSTYPQCVDCFIRTNQTQFLDAGSDQLPSILQGMRQVCDIASTLLGNVSASNGETNGTSSPPPPSTDTGAGPLFLVRPWLILATLVSVVAILL